jgi:thioester reductase-like protein
VLLTGATGLLGRYLLRDLLLGGRPVTVLARPAGHETGPERVARLLAFWSEQLRQPLPQPTILSADLTLPGLGLMQADRRWVARHCGAVVHAAANLSFRPAPDGEPWCTNVEGTRALLELAGELGLAEWHHVSTAFVCGRRSGVIREHDLDCGQDFHNPYEQSKLEAERLVQAARGLRVTVYRPSVIVGDSRTGYTSSYAGFYRFLELAVRLAKANTPSPAGARQLPLRLPLTGTERWDLVPVDWVAQAIGRLLDRPRWHGRTFHLVARAPIAARFLRDAASAELNIEGVELIGPHQEDQRGPLERRFLEGLQDYWPYLRGTPTFTWDNTAAALPDLPAPPLDRPLLARLLGFAARDRWGRRRLHRPPMPRASVERSRCAEYVERVFPEQARRWRLARAVRLDLVVGLDVRGQGGGQWTCRWTAGELRSVTRGLEDHAAVVYHTDTATFDAILHGRLSPQQAFFEQRLTIWGEMETALKLVVLFTQFLEEHPYPSPHRLEAADAPRP